MNHPDQWRNSIIKSPNDGLIVLLTTCLEQAEKENDRYSFFKIWVNPPKLHYAWLLLRTYDPRYRMVVKEIEYHTIPHGNTGKLKLDKKNGKV